MKIKDIKLENSLWSAQLTIVSDDRQELERIFENAGKVDPEKEYGTRTGAGLLVKWHKGGG